MKLIYKPFGSALGMISGFIATRVFGAVWERIDGGEPPKPLTREAKLKRVLLATSLQAVAFSGTRAIVERGGARTWDRLFGTWPGKEPKKKGAAQAS